MSCLRYLCLFANSGVQHIFCCVFLHLCVPCVGSFSGLFIFDSPSVFKKVIIEKFVIRLADIKGRNETENGCLFRVLCN